MGSLAKYYDPASAEQRWYRHWIENNSFHADETSDREPFSIVIPPPNVTGYLHIGHALCMTLQDVLVRYKRMDGYETLWLPGTDHASIATQIVVEKQLAEQGIDRVELGREAFLDKVWEWKEHSGSRIIEQLKRLGCSCDWERERFTMDDQCSRAVTEAFVRLYEQGHIYRGKRLVNWCPVQQTSLSDLEVNHEDIEGAMHHIRYPVVGHADTWLTVATTRPETMLGDTAVIVHPEDERYRHLIGAQVELPLCNRRIPVIGDAYVDREFGSGAMKVTPAHDFNDFEIGQRHQMPMINIFTPDARINDQAPEAYRGMDRFEARKAVLADLDSAGLLECVEPHMHSVGTAERSGAIVEPYLSDQWFVDVSAVAKRSRDAVESREVELVPAVWEKTFYHWMDNIRDWCISRQLWWGHRIPAWYCRSCNAVLVQREAPDTCPHCASANLEQDEDVLDTWFSSQLWPFATMGWPDRTAMLDKFYPTSVLVTGFDILFFWVARMMMAAYSFMDERPFRQVYLHSLIRDKYGRKMSKSIGNVIDPLEVIDKYGADALRFTLISQTGQGRDIKLDINRIEGYTTFVNKMWNALKFAVQTRAEGTDAELPPVDALDVSDIWILSQLNGCIDDVRHNLDAYHFNEAAASLYRFVWQDICDWYIELAKHRLYKGTAEQQRTASRVLNVVLHRAMSLLHPFMPFVTEEIAAHLVGAEKSLCTGPFPRPVDLPGCEQAIVTMGALMHSIEAIRRIRGEMNISPGTPLKGTLLCADPEIRTAAQEYFSYYQSLARLESLDVRDPLGFERPRGSAAAVFAQGEVILPLEGILDFDAELARLQKEYAKVEKDFLVYDRKLSNPGFLKNAREEVILKDRHKRDELGAILDALRTNIETIKEYL